MSHRIVARDRFTRTRYTQNRCGVGVMVNKAHTPPTKSDTRVATSAPPVGRLGPDATAQRRFNLDIKRAGSLLFQIMRSPIVGSHKLSQLIPEGDHTGRDPMNESAATAPNHYPSGPYPSGPLTFVLGKGIGDDFTPEIANALTASYDSLR